jgi:hypothetical protein
MARGIYKRTMHRVSATDPEDTPADARSPDAAANEAAANTRDQDDSSAPPLIGKRTQYVDRQVARRARARARSKRKQIRRLQVYVTLLILCVIFLSMGWILASTKLREHLANSATLDADLRKMELKLEEAEVRLEDRERDLLNLAKNRIPGLEKITYNKILDVNDKYFLNITFSEAGVGGETVLEYRAMLINSSAEMVLPRVKIFLFDEFGLQVGVSELRKDHATSDVALAELASEETRSYHSQFEVERNAIAKYYMVHVE